MHNMHPRKNFPSGLEALPLADQYTGLKQLLKAPGLTPEERGSFGTMLGRAGLLDTFRWRHPEATGAFSYYSQRFPANRVLNKGLRLDYVLADPAICTDDDAPAPAAAAAAAGHADAEPTAPETAPKPPAAARATHPGPVAAAAQKGGSAAAAAAAAAGVRLVDSYILDDIGFIADHVAVGCDLVLPEPE